MRRTTELVVLCDSDGTPTGTAPKATVHTCETPLHRAFSCYLLDDAGNLLLTQRSLTKATWPGIWTNSFCGHPGPGESDFDAVVRRSQQELGLSDGALLNIELVLPDFAYRAVDDSGIVEWEVCPVFVAGIRDTRELAPRPSEVEQFIWMPLAEVFDTVQQHPQRYSPWMVEQLGHQQLRDALMRKLVRGDDGEEFSGNRIG
ncbi:MAG: isopentenyl-diphosphate Delta-isomerase [Corynebacterium sp.]|nr:isopentenyl-diphosphate Delta-isomerase [Corynebacterium sp.]